MISNAEHSRLCTGFAQIRFSWDRVIYTSLWNYFKIVFWGFFLSWQVEKSSASHQTEVEGPKRWSRNRERFVWTPALFPGFHDLSTTTESRSWLKPSTSTVWCFVAGGGLGLMRNAIGMLLCRWRAAEPAALPRDGEEAKPSLKHQLPPEAHPVWHA